MKIEAALAARMRVTRRTDVENQLRMKTRRMNLRTRMTKMRAIVIRTMGLSDGNEDYKLNVTRNSISKLTF